MGMTLTERRRWSAAEVRRLIDEGAAHWPLCELIDGELLVTAAPSPVHQLVLANLFRVLDEYVRRERLGRVLWSPADLELTPEHINQPDIFVVPAAGGPLPSSWREVKQLLLTVEVLSASTARFDRVIKRAYYQRANVPEYWIIDIDARIIERWRLSDDRPEILDATLVWSVAGASAALEIHIDRIWDGLARARR